ncbi:Zn(2)-Cys(6) zinc finger domain protein [Purpureocillium lavendulum]|uniref:Zn(2)-Cys(6) zinc finger domain protein n=1 Tax=Purpureocillium lavendulum TaxID=1247861 RepID=A0AB34FZ74_9HYPO|nr:Zn(2)-Cys(6) zinc finger domain protein [Purpureocillium lavendulum]
MGASSNTASYLPLRQIDCPDLPNRAQKASPTHHCDLAKKVLFCALWLFIGFWLGLQVHTWRQDEFEIAWSFTDGTASLIAATREDVERSRKTSEVDWFNSTVEYGAANGGGYMATLEMFHQLHCLNMLRKAVHHDYYKRMAPSANGTYPRNLMTHLDHCVEIIRQVISCRGDVGLITFHWVEGNPVPYPDFNTWHQCRDHEEILAWAKTQEAPLTAPLEKKMFTSLVEMPHAP